MKKSILFIIIIIAIIIIIISVYCLFKIYCIMKVDNGKLYDGFGTPYGADREPNSPYTIYGIVGIVSGFSLLSYCYKQRENNKDKEDV